MTNSTFMFYISSHLLLMGSERIPAVQTDNNFLTRGYRVISQFQDMKMVLDGFHTTDQASVIMWKDYKRIAQKALSTSQLCVILSFPFQERNSPPPSSRCVSWWASGRRWASPTRTTRRSSWAWGQAARGRGWSSAAGPTRDQRANKIDINTGRKKVSSYGGGEGSQGVTTIDQNVRREWK